MVLSTGVMRLLPALGVCLLLLMLLAKHARGDVTTAQPENETSTSTSNTTSSILITITNQSSVQSIPPNSTSSTSSTSSTDSNPTGSQNASDSSQHTSSPYTPSRTFTQTSTEYLHPKYPATTPLITANTKKGSNVTQDHLPDTATSNWASSWVVQGFLLLSMIIPAVVL